MTGYGRGAAQNEHAAVEVELRSVNGKSLNLKLRLPSDRLELEAEAEALLRSRFERGSLNGTVRIRLMGSSAPVPDESALLAHLDAWRRMQAKLGLHDGDPNLSQLLALPGAFLPASETGKVTKGVRSAVLEACEHAADALREARLREGRRLAKELIALTKKMSRHLARAEKRVPIAVKEAQKRMAERVDTALQSVELSTSPTLDLSRELVALADRADVREEVARLHIHLESLHRLFETGGPCGREIEFVLQEVHREITTLGNKSSDQKLSEEVVAMKLLAGQLKEQVANVE